VARDNVEFIRRFIDAFNRDGIAGIADSIADDHLAYPFPEWPDEPAYEGSEGFRRLVAEWTDQFDDYRWVAHDIRDAGDGVVVLAEHFGTPKVGGGEVGQRIAAIFGDFRADGAIGRSRFFLQWEEALEAAGLGAHH
jgi:ketosteroid isomerase-like protein